MATKIRPLGAERVVVRNLPHVTIIKNNGTSLTSWDVQPNHPPWDRRFGESSKISSESGVDSRFRPCTHTRETYRVSPLSVLPEYLYWYTQSNLPSSERHSYGYEMMARVHKLRYTQFTAAVDATNSSLGETQWNALSAEALNQMLPSFANGNSYINYLLELKDFKDVMKYLDSKISLKLADLASQLSKNGLKTIRHIGKKGITLQGLSRRYLEYQFGWKPLFRDIASFFESGKKFLKRFEELVKRAEEPQQSYWGTWISGTDASDEVAYLNSGDGIGAAGIGVGRQKVFARVLRLSSKGTRFHATVRYRYPLPDELAGVGAKLKALLDVIGVNANPAILWNAIPFTFVVDWLVNVGGFLNRLRVENIHFKTEIMDFCTSAKYQRSVEYSVSGYQSNYMSPVAYQGPWIVMDSCQKSTYERRLGLPNFLTALQTSGLNSREFLLTGALMGANPRKPRKGK